MRKSLVSCLISASLAALSASAATWTPRAPLPGPRCAGGSGTAIVNGSLYLIGGATTGATAGATAGATNDEYNPLADSWSANTPNPRADGRTNLNSNAVRGDAIWFFGGTSVSFGNNTNGVDVYRPSTDEWFLNTASYVFPIAGVGTTVRGPRIYCFGGDFFGPATLSARFDTVVLNYFILASMPTARIDPVVVDTGAAMWLIGGHDGTNPLASVDVYDTTLGTWSSGPSLPVASRAHAGGIVSGNIHVLLGDGVYRLTSGTWTKIANAPPISGDYAAAFLGDHVHVMGGCGTAHYALNANTPVDTTPPVIASVTPSVTTLNPPNHRMVPVTVSVVASDDTDPAPVAKIVSVTSNEPDNGLGDGDTAGDIVLTGPLSVQLRAERAGKGNGRVYTIVVEVADASGNVATRSTSVIVPRK